MVPTGPSGGTALTVDNHCFMPISIVNDGTACVGSAKATRRRGGQPPCKAGHPWLGRGQGPLCKGAASSSQGQLEREANDAHNGRQPPAGAAARRGRACRQKNRPRGQQPSTGTVAYNATPGKGPAIGHLQGAGRGWRRQPKWWPPLGRVAASKKG
ncbi:hypothetical protein BHM03_00062142 [Ensete ventricosum]|nr:hypothetical protein BHM03_00062142 [Ensete ventricosum]